MEQTSPQDGRRVNGKGAARRPMRVPSRVPWTGVSPCACFLEALAESVLVTDARGMVEFANASACRFLGYSPEELAGKDLRMLLPPVEPGQGPGGGPDGSCAPGARERARLLTKDGECLEVALSVRPLVDERGKTLGTLRTFLPVGEGGEFENLLRAQRGFAEALLAAVPLVVLVTDVRGRILRSNRHAWQVTGYAEGELQDQDWTALLAASPDGPRLKDAAAQVGLGRLRDYQDESALRTKDGSEAEIAWHVSAMPGEAGQPAGVLVVGQDLTEGRDRSDRLGQASRMESIGRLAAGICHDFNNQMSVVSAYCEMLLRELPGDSPARQSVVEIHRAAVQTSKLAAQLVGFGQRRPPRPRVVDLNAVLARLADPLARMLGEEVHLVIQPGEGVACVLADPVQLEQVIMDLAAGAHQAMPRGGQLVIETANIRLDAPRDRHPPEAAGGSYVMLAATDSGGGPARDGARQAIGTVREGPEFAPGGGPGLEFVYRFVRQNGGNLSIYSEPGLGVTFAIYLPSVAPADPDAEPRLSGPSGVRPGRTILVVDESEPLRRLIGRVLRECDYRVLEAASAEDALRQVAQCPGEVDLVVTDVVMPGMSGSDLARQLRASRPRVRVLFISAYPPDVVADHGVSPGDANFLAKPFSLAELARAVRRTLEPAGPEQGDPAGGD